MGRYNFVIHAEFEERQGGFRGKFEGETQLEGSADFEQVESAIQKTTALFSGNTRRELAVSFLAMDASYNEITLYRIIKEHNGTATVYCWPEKQSGRTGTGVLVEQGNKATSALVKRVFLDAWKEARDRYFYD